VAARAQQAEQMRPKQGFSESRISLEENLQELQWQQRKASNYDSENRAVADGATEARDERTVDLSSGTASQHLLRSTARQASRRVMKPVAASPPLTQARAENPTPGAWLIRTPSVLPSAYK